MDAQEQRRLLELAAKAVGFIDDATDESVGNGMHRGSDDVFYITSPDGWREWSPTEDDGDALRLAVNLRLTVNLTECRCCAGVYACQLDGEGDYPDISVRHSSEFDDAETTDPYAAVRLAIVRAAAAIGEKMETKP